jgi:hypothetical protein
MWGFYLTKPLFINPVDIVNVRLTHKTACVPLLEAAYFKDKANEYSELVSFDGE